MLLRASADGRQRSNLESVWFLSFSPLSENLGRILSMKILCSQLPSLIDFSVSKATRLEQLIRFPFLAPIWLNFQPLRRFPPAFIRKSPMPFAPGFPSNAFVNADAVVLIKILKKFFEYSIDFNQLLPNDEKCWQSPAADVVNSLRESSDKSDAFKPSRQREICFALRVNC